MTRQIFYFERLSTFDKWTIGFYFALTLGAYYFFGIQNQVVFGYAILTQLALYLFCYKSLRNLTAFTIWLGIGFFHLYLYFKLRDVPTLQMLRGHSSTPLRNTIPLLFLFQILRFLSAKIQGQELVAPSRGATTDLFDDRRVNWLDFLFFFIYTTLLVISSL
jgi:hypothetical protein